ncbi:MAG TPA: glutathione synthase, partial [Candidatus Omnitrophota bacterium]|nr:glutathione synthase [Candidatus Omnitrophota bacterium]
STNPFPQRTPHKLNDKEIDCVFIRSDPPFDSQYLLNTWLLDRLPARIPVINTPSGIRSANEKIWTTQFQGIVPRTLIGRNRQEILDFLLLEKNIVVKPTDGFGGSSVFHIHVLDKNAKVILETMTHHWTKDVVLQQYLQESQEGDKRILLLNGEALGAVLRMHAEDDHRNNFFAGGKPLATDINARDCEIIGLLKPELQKLGLYFVGIDIIGGYLIEVNVTSPTCLQEMNRLYGQKLEEKIIEFAEKLVEQNRRKE